MGGILARPDDHGGLFRKRPVEIHARRVYASESVKTLEGTMTCGVGDWMITGVEGEQYPCKDSIFRKTYEPVDEQAESTWAELYGAGPPLP